jgi:hypothetical protein
MFERSDVFLFALCARGCYSARIRSHFQLHKPTNTHEAASVSQRASIDSLDADGLAQEPPAT